MTSGRTYTSSYQGEKVKKGNGVQTIYSGGDKEKSIREKTTPKKKKEEEKPRYKLTPKQKRAKELAAKKKAYTPGFITTAKNFFSSGNS
tara:strand:- start:21 stop:287 length:267 start_codon:yes stop_codon:yes gene_type:complete